MEKQAYVVGNRVEKLCAVCGVERGHVVASVTKQGRVSRVDCPKCDTRSTFKSGVKLAGAGDAPEPGALYDRTRSYRKGQLITHPSFGPGEVTAVIEPQKIDVLFADRVRRIIHETSPV